MLSLRLPAPHPAHVHALAALRTTLWARKQRELSVLKLVRHLHAFADRWLQLLFESEADLRYFLSQVWGAHNGTRCFELQAYDVLSHAYVQESSLAHLTPAVAFR